MKNANKYVAPQAVFDLDGEIVKMIHDCHCTKEGQDLPQTPPRHSKAGTTKGKKVKEIDLVNLDGSGDCSADTDDNSQGDSASSTDSSGSQSGVMPCKTPGQKSAAGNRAAGDK